MRGPKAPKDPVAKRPAVYVMVDAVIDGSPRGNGKFQDIIYLNGRIVQKISVLCKDVPKDVLDLVPNGQGFRKLVHSIGVTVLATKKDSCNSNIYGSCRCCRTSCFGIIRCRLCFYRCRICSRAWGSLYDRRIPSDLSFDCLPALVCLQCIFWRIYGT